MKPETGHLEGPNWDTPPNGDFAAYVQRLTAPAALVKPAPFSPPVLIQAQTSPQKTAQQKKNRPKPPALAALRKLPSRRQRHVWLATAFTFAGLFLEFIWLVLKFLLNIGLLFVPGGGLLSAILEQRKKPQQLRHWGVIVFLSALLSLLARGAGRASDRCAVAALELSSHPLRSGAGRGMAAMAAPFFRSAQSCLKACLQIPS